MRKYYYKYNGIFVEIILYGVHLKGKGASGVQSGPKATSTHSLDGIIPASQIREKIHTSIQR